MVAIDSFLVEFPEVTKNLNAAMILTIEKLEELKIISKETGEDFLSHWRIVLWKDSWFEEILKRFKKEPKNVYKFTIVQIKADHERKNSQETS